MGVHLLLVLQRCPEPAMCAADTAVADIVVADTAVAVDSDGSKATF